VPGQFLLSGRDLGVDQGGDYRIAAQLVQAAAAAWLDAADRDIDHTSGAYRSTRSSHARVSPFRARSPGQ
jgi:hypothetical protein